MRTTMGQTRLTNLTIMSLESDKLRQTSIPCWRGLTIFFWVDWNYIMILFG